ncbi:MAG TPA: hypothetical protein DD379_18715 [Cyanobacteria bacterium UBA11162]|nr:hypothetical protein [Cyanobacteria bacterium UBA11162]
MSDIRFRVRQFLVAPSVKRVQEGRRQGSLCSKRVKRVQLNRYFRQTTLALIVGSFLLLHTSDIILAQGIPQRWEAREYKPRIGIGSPRRVEGGGTRSTTSNCPVNGKPLTALVPTNGFGVTVTPYPTFFVYMPATSSEGVPLEVEFILKDSNKNEIYQTRFETTGRAGIIAISLPSEAGLSPLEMGEDYQWSFSMICQDSDRAKDRVVQGALRRVQLDPILETQLKQASPEQQIELYAGGEIWHEALARLVELRREHPTDPTVAAQWVQLLNAAGLGDMAQESLVSNPTTRRGQPSSLE